MAGRGRTAEAVGSEAHETPRLCVVIDTEEEFDWSQPLARENRSVRSIAAQPRAQEIFARYGIVPTYVIDYPVASDPDAAGLLREFQDSGAALIGAHLHPWVNPPHHEEVCPANSYPGNLPPALEEAKLLRLTEAIEGATGRRPRVYKAGRYGLGPNTPAILARLGYEVDVSVVPYTAFIEDGGPDFRNETPRPRRLGDGVGDDLLSLPLSVGFAGILRRWGPRVYPLASGPWGMRLHAPGVLARSRLLERIRLTPEGVDLDAQIRLTRALLKDGFRLFNYAYHSPSLAVGNTPYVQSERDLARFLDRMDRYFDFFVNRLGGRPATPLEIRDLLRV